jgi:D-arabinose 1-dehydrogenase-like Zn-dependent alcohol dehydrogenase
MTIISPRSTPASDTSDLRASSASETMLAARQHERGEPLRVERVERPRAAGTDVVVEVKACGMVPNLANVLANWETWFPHEPLPPRPAIFGLDPVGVVHEVGEQVIGVRPGDRVYVNPTRSCGACYPCAAGRPQECHHWVFAGYFAFNHDGVAMFERYPYGGFCEYMRAPQTALVKLPDSLDFRHATRLGYLGTTYAAVKKLGPLAGKSMLVHGATGTLGVGTTLVALALGVSKVYAVARGLPLLERLQALAPGRIEIFSNTDGGTADWVRSRTGGLGADFHVDTLAAVGSLESFKDAVHAVRRGGTIVNIGGAAGEVGLDPKYFMDNAISFVGSAWFTTAECMELVGLIEAGVLDIQSVLEPKTWPFEQINDAINGVNSGDGGFTSYLVEL